MALHVQDDGTVVISSGHCWLPGVYESPRAARLAFRCDEGTLQAMQDAANTRASGQGGVITLDEVRAGVRRHQRRVERWRANVAWGNDADDPPIGVPRPVAPHE